MRYFLTVLGWMLCLIEPSYADEGCSALAPTNSEKIDETFKGDIEGKISGLVGRIAGGQASIEGEYQRLKEDTLNQYDDHHRLYVWQRTLYLVCIKPELGIDINSLLQLYLAGPPDGQRGTSSELRKRYQLALESLVTSLMRKDEFMFPAMERFIADPIEENWRRVVWTAQENLNQVREAINASLAYDAAASDEIATASAFLNIAYETANRRYERKFTSVRREWDGRSHVLRAITETRNIPTIEQAKEWHAELEGYFFKLKDELQILAQATD